MTTGVVQAMSKNSTHAPRLSTMTRFNQRAMSVVRAPEIVRGLANMNTAVLATNAPPPSHMYQGMR